MPEFGHSRFHPTKARLSDCLGRVVLTRLDDAALDELNKQIEVELQEQGTALPPVKTIRAKRVPHVVVTNNHSRQEDFEVLVLEMIQIGKELVESNENTT